MRFPAFFIGHGSPMNAIANTAATKVWEEAAREIPRPESILVVSAHWTEPRVGVLSMDRPSTIHDFGNFPRELFDKQYPSPGSPALAHRVQSLLKDTVNVELVDKGWGLDHGSWSVLSQMYPEADIPVIELTLDSRKSDEWHFELGRKLAPLRDENVLILGSGSLVHNLYETRFSNKPEPEQWARTFNEFVIANIGAREPAESHPLVQWTQHPLAKKNHPTPEHYQPLLYILGLIDAHKDDQVTTMLEDDWDGSAISMLSVKVEETVKEQESKTDL